MKFITTFFMGLAIIVGLILAITPFVADKIFPLPENSVRVAKPDAAAMALKRWFKSPDAPFIDVQAINQSSPQQKVAWFSFSVGRGPVEKYILTTKLKQKTLTPDILKNTFYVDNPPATWWHPEAIQQETYFSGKDQDRYLALLYNPETKRGVLVTNSQPFK